MKVKIPEVLKCGSITYQFKQVESLLIESDRAGEFRPHRSEIVIDSKLSIPAKTPTLIHEYLHAVDRNYHIGFDDDTIDRVANGMAELFQCLGIELEW